MDGGQRHSPSGRRVINGSSEQPVYRQPEPQQPQPQQQAQPVPQQQTPQVSSGATLNTAPKSSHRSSAASITQPQPAKAPNRRRKLPLLIAAGIILLALLGFFGWSLLQNKGMVIDSSKYQAVFFTNGQVYFGKLEAKGTEYLHLSDVFYLQTNSETPSENPQQATATTDESNVQLIKLGDEIHGPEDEMIISKDQVLFYENLKTDGKVTQSIQQYKNSNN
jgi:hypothetical protein